MIQHLPPKDYWEERLKENFNLHGTGFITLGRNYNNWMYKVRRRVVLKKIMPICHNDFHKMEVLDIGTGTGFYFKVWKELGAKKAVGVDITNIAVENLKRNFPGEEFYQLDIGGDIRNIARHQYDLISAFSVLYHIIDDGQYEKAIENICSLLRPGGIFVFSDNFLHGQTLRSTYQVSRSLELVEKILAKNSFEIIERCPMFVLMNAPVDTERSTAIISWNVIQSLIKRNEALGSIIGGILYPLELLLVSFLKESPTTEMMICKKAS